MQPGDDRLDRGGEPHGERHERRRLRRQRHRHGAQVAADGGHPARRVRHADPRLGEHLKAVGAEQPGHGGLAGQIGGAGEPRRELTVEELDHGGAAGRRNDQRESVALAEHPGVHHDHALGGEQRAVDQAGVAGLLEVVGQESLQAGERARTRDPEHGGLGADHGGAVAHLIQSRAVQPDVELSHGPRAARRRRGR